MTAKLTAKGEPKADVENDGRFLENENGCGPGRDSFDGTKSLGLDELAVLEVDVSVPLTGSPNIEVFAFLPC